MIASQEPLLPFPLDLPAQLRKLFATVSAADEDAQIKRIAEQLLANPSECSMYMDMLGKALAEIQCLKSNVQIFTLLDVLCRASEEPVGAFASHTSFCFVIERSAFSC